MMTTSPQPAAVLIFFTRMMCDLSTRGRREYPDARHGLPWPYSVVGCRRQRVMARTRFPAE